MTELLPRRSNPGAGGSGTLGQVSGTLAARPAPSGQGWYFATDDNGGTLYHSDGTTWTKQAPGVAEPAGTELGYAQVVANQTSITSTTSVALTGLSLTITVGTRPIKLILDCNWQHNTAGGAVGLQIFDTTPGAINSGAVEIGRKLMTISTASGYAPVHVEARPSPAPAAGTRTYAAACFLVTAAQSSNMLANSSYPAFLQAVTV